MKPLLRTSIVVALAGCLSACFFYRAPVVPPVAGTFNSTSAPMNLHLRSTELGPKRGEATATCILGLISFGDASIGQAARNGNIKMIKHADSELLIVLYVLYASHTTVVYGE